MSAGDLLGYLDRWSVLPGERLSCRVSLVGGGPCQADLVRIVQGDRHPDAPGYREVEVADLGTFQAIFQPLSTGSCAVIAPRAPLAIDGAVSFAATVWPTLPGTGEQVIASRLDARGANGLSLGIGADGAAFAEAVVDGVATRVSSGATVHPRRWYRLGMAHDPASGKLQVVQLPLDRQPALADAGEGAATTPAGRSLFDVDAPLYLARRGGAVPGGWFNGRIHAPELRAGAIDQGALVAAWDFSLEIPSTRIVDVSGNGLHGELVNLPTRAVTGPDWDGSCHCWTHDAGHYGAIHFHDDDLYDANWSESLSVALPGDLASGVYAVRLRAADDVFYLPFCVRARAGERADTVLLLPTASYLAYANNRIGLDVAETELVCGRLVELTPLDLFAQTHPALGLSFYDVHNDGSPVYYSSRLRPVLDLQPGFVGKLGGAGSNVWQFNADTHLTGWFEHLGSAVDVVTDEDLAREGSDCLAGYRVLVTGSHPEYCSAAMLDALDDFLDAGGRMMYLGGNGFYWRISHHPRLPGVIECRKSEDGIRAAPPGPGEYYASFTGEYSGLWRRNGRTPNQLVGVGMVAQGFDRAMPYTRTADSDDPRAAFIFAGIDARQIGSEGLSGGGAAGIELDAANIELGTPRHALVLARSDGHSDLYLVTPEDMLDPVPGLGGSESELIGAELVFFETAAGGAVFSTGSIAWAGAMAWNGYDNDIARITDNVLRRFRDPASFPPPGSAS